MLLRRRFLRRLPTIAKMAAIIAIAPATAWGDSSVFGLVNDVLNVL